MLYGTSAQDVGVRGFLDESQVNAFREEELERRKRSKAQGGGGGSFAQPSPVLLRGLIHIATHFLHADLDDFHESLPGFVQEYTSVCRLVMKNKFLRNAQQQGQGGEQKLVCPHCGKALDGGVPGSKDHLEMMRHIDR